MAHTRITILIADAIQEVRLVVLPLRVAGVDFGQRRRIARLCS
jgi:hypothetical protein